MVLENSLASVAVTRPFVKNQDAREILDVDDVLKLIVGKIVANAGFDHPSRIERGKLPAAAARNTGSCHLDAEIVGIFDQPVRHLDHFDAGHRQSKPKSKICCQHFICQNSDVLRVVHELGDIVGAVGSSEKMRLRSSSHSAQVLHCGDTSVHLRISGVELACEAGFQRLMEKGWFGWRVSYFRVAISPEQKTSVSSFENRSFSRMMVFPSSSSSDLSTSLTDCQCAMCRASPSPKIPLSIPAVQSRPTCPPCRGVSGRPATSACCAKRTGEAWR